MLLKKSIHGIDLDIFSDIGNCGVVTVTVQEGHNQEFYNTKSHFHYIILEGSGNFFLDDEVVVASKGDMISILPNTRIYYKGNMKMILITNPPYDIADEIEIRPTIW